MDLNEAVIVSGCGTPIGNFMGALKDISARELAIIAGKEAIEKTSIPADNIDEICMGQVYSAMQGSLPARQVLVRIGLPYRGAVVSVNQNCAASMRTL